MPSNILLFDFDGTVAIGNGPLRAYARAAAASLDVSGAERMLAEFEESLAVTTTHTGPLPLDGYDLVARIADRAGIDREALSGAYLESRRMLATSFAPIATPPGLPDFLVRVKSHGAIPVLATNAPSIRIGEALDALGLSGVFDQVITGANKPTGLGAVIDRILTNMTDVAGASAAPVRLLSVGDVWVNDLAPAHQRGFDTALVGPYLPQGATPTYRAERLENLYPTVERWLGIDDQNDLLTAAQLDSTNPITTEQR